MDPLLIIKDNFEDIGEIPITEIDDMNIPIICFISPPDENEDKKWHWTAENYVPRKSRIINDMYEIIADNKKDILNAVRKYVVPFYQTAIRNLKIKGELYYWNDE